MLRFVKGYKKIAIIQVLMCICFFISQDQVLGGKLFWPVNLFGTGALLVGSIWAYVSTHRGILWTMAVTMMCLIVFNTVWFICEGAFMSEGFTLIAYDTLFVVANLHFLGKGL